jgi:hypothetical protein
VVGLQQPTKPFPTRDLVGSLADLLARFDELIDEPLVISLSMPLVISLSMLVLEKSSDRPT